MASSSILRNLVPHMLWETQCFLQTRVESADAVRLFLNAFRQTADGGPALNDTAVAEALLAAYEAAHPGQLGGTDEDSLCILAHPASVEGDDLERIARQTLPRTRVQFAQSVDEIVIYREQLYASLAALKQIARTAKPAYERVANHENLTPHSRLDITDWLPLNV
jgi:hypothetical protein